MRDKGAVPLVWRRSLNHDWSLQSSNPQTGAAEWAVKGLYDPTPASPQKQKQQFTTSILQQEKTFIFTYKKGKQICNLMYAGIWNVIFLCLWEE